MVTNQPSPGQLDLPRWLAVVYAAVAAGLIPWIEVLSYTLPTRHVSAHWDIAWVGFDVAILAAILTTAALSLRRSSLVALPAMSVFTLLTVDAWFDILTSRGSSQMTEAVLMALIVELPLAALSLWLAIHAARAAIKTDRPS